MNNPTVINPSKIPIKKSVSNPTPKKKLAKKWIIVISIIVVIVVIIIILGILGGLGYLTPSNNSTTPVTRSPITSTPTMSPTMSPTFSPTEIPTMSPTFSPTEIPTMSPTFSPTEIPTMSPTFSPITVSPTTAPISAPVVSKCYNVRGNWCEFKDIDTCYIDTNDIPDKMFANVVNQEIIDFVGNNYVGNAPILGDYCFNISLSAYEDSSFMDGLFMIIENAGADLIFILRETDNYASYSINMGYKKEYVNLITQNTGPDIYVGSIWSTEPTPIPKYICTIAPTHSPTSSPTSAPTVAPTSSPTTAPTTSPTKAPTTSPTTSPTISPTTSPTKAPISSNCMINGIDACNNYIYMKNVDKGMYWYNNVGGTSEYGNGAGMVILKSKTDPLDPNIRWKAYPAGDGTVIFKSEGQSGGIYYQGRTQTNPSGYYAVNNNSGIKFEVLYQQQGYNFIKNTSNNKYLDTNNSNVLTDNSRNLTGYSVEWIAELAEPQVNYEYSTQNIRCYSDINYNDRNNYVYVLNEFNQPQAFDFDRTNPDPDFDQKLYASATFPEGSEDIIKGICDDYIDCKKYNITTNTDNTIKVTFYKNTTLTSTNGTNTCYTKIV